MIYSTVSIQPADYPYYQEGIVEDGVGPTRVGGFVFPLQNSNKVRGNLWVDTTTPISQGVQPGKIKKIKGIPKMYPQGDGMYIIGHLHVYDYLESSLRLPCHLWEWKPNKPHEKEGKLHEVEMWSSAKDSRVIARGATRDWRCHGKEPHAFILEAKDGDIFVLGKTWLVCRGGVIRTYPYPSVWTDDGRGYRLLNQQLAAEFERTGYPLKNWSYPELIRHLSPQ